MVQPRAFLCVKDRPELAVGVVLAQPHWTPQAEPLRFRFVSFGGFDHLVCMSSSNSPLRNTHMLSKCRTSSYGEVVFVTCCTKNKSPVLANDLVFDAVAEVSSHMKADMDWDPFFITVMPDHIHLLFQNRQKLSLSKIVAKYKVLLNREIDGLWQRSFHDHRIRNSEEIEKIGFYMFMNPYKNGLIPLSRIWNGHLIYQPNRFSFLSKCEWSFVPRSAWLKSKFAQKWDSPS